MKLKKSGLILINIGIIIFSVVIGLFIDSNLRTGANDEKKLISEISNSYDKFKRIVGIYSEERVSFVSLMDENSYLEDLTESSEDLINSISTLETSVDSMVSASSILLKDCTNLKVNDDDTVNKCEAFFTNYEQVVNYHVRDVKSLNALIDNYNSNYVTNCNALTNCVGSKSIDNFKSNYTEYVDLNNDGIYNGREE